VQTLGLQERVELFLELYGNSRIRPNTSDFLIAFSNRMINMVCLVCGGISSSRLALNAPECECAPSTPCPTQITDVDLAAKEMPYLDISALKFRERDDLEAIFKFWRNDDPK
jgi:dynein assembly factor 3